VYSHNWRNSNIFPSYSIFHPWNSFSRCILFFPNPVFTNLTILFALLSPLLFVKILVIYSFSLNLHFLDLSKPLQYILYIAMVLVIRITLFLFNHEYFHRHPRLYFFLSISTVFSLSSHILLIHRCRIIILVHFFFCFQYTMSSSPWYCCNSIHQSYLPIEATQSSLDPLHIIGTSHAGRNTVLKFYVSSPHLSLSYFYPHFSSIKSCILLYYYPYDMW
jgi:hypothetical protein